MRDDWECEVRYNRGRLREEGLTPYREAVKWRRRFWACAVFAAFLLALLLALVSVERPGI
jgi:hypothetical protein